MTAVELERFAAVLDELGEYPDVATRARSLAVQLRSAINTYGIVNHPVHGRIYAFEVDCYSSSYIMDDANIPSLLALPYLGFVDRDDEVYLRTRSVILSSDNPFYFSGTAGAGIGGPHVGLGYIWPMALSVQVRRGGLVGTRNAWGVEKGARLHRDGRRAVTVTRGRCSDAKPGGRPSTRASRAQATARSARCSTSSSLRRRAPT